MKKFLLAFLCMLTLGISPGLAADYTVTFVNQPTTSDSNTLLGSSEDFISNGSSYIASKDIQGSVYKAKIGYGLLIGSSSNYGKLNLNLASTVQVSANSIYVLCATASGTSGTLRYIVHFSEGEPQSGQFTSLNTYLEAKTIALNNSSPITSIELASLQNTQCYVKGFTIDTTGTGGITATGSTEKFTVKITGKSTAELENISGDVAPPDLGISYTQTYTTKCQSTSGNSATLTLSGLDGCAITGIRLYTHSNANAGGGSMNITNGKYNLLHITGGYMSEWSTNFTDSYEWISPSMIFPNHIIGAGEKVVLKLEATTNSLYWEKAEITYIPTSTGGDTTTYSVIYDANEGSGSVIDSNTYAAGANVTVLGSTGLSREGYTFTGWNTAADGSGTARAAGSTFEMPASNVTLYAQWEAASSSTFPTYNVTDCKYTEDTDLATATWHDFSEIEKNKSVQFKYVKWEGCPIYIHYLSGGNAAALYNNTPNFRWYKNSVMEFVANNSVVSIDKITFNKSGSSVTSTNGSVTISGTSTNTQTIWEPTAGTTVTTANMKNETDGQLNPTTFTFEYTEATSVAVASVTLNKTEAALVVGATETLTATVEPTDATDKTVTWSSSESDVASVDEYGKVTAVAPGTATITATADGVSATCTVTVEAPSLDFYVTATVNDGESASVAKGQNITLKATVGNATGEVEYQWYWNTSASTENKNTCSGEGATSAEYTFAASEVGTRYYYCYVMDSELNEAESDFVTVTVTAAKVYKRVTDIAQLSNNDDIIIAAYFNDASMTTSHSWYGMSNQSSSSNNNNRLAVAMPSIDKDAQTISNLPAGVTNFKLLKNADETWSIKDEESGKYLCNSSSNTTNRLQFTEGNTSEIAKLTLHIGKETDHPYISPIVFTSGRNNVYLNSGKSGSGSSATISPIFNCYVEGYNANYYIPVIFVAQDPDKPGDAEFDPGSGTVLIGTEGDTQNNNKVYVTSAGATEIKYRINNGDILTISGEDIIEGLAALPTLTESCRVEAWGVNTNVSPEKEGEHTTATYTVVYYPAAPTFSPATDSSIKFGDEITITSAGADKIRYTIEYTVDGSTQVETVTKTTDENGKISFRINKIGDVIINAVGIVTVGEDEFVNPADEATGMAMYEVAALADKTYRKVSDLDDLVDGREYLIATANDTGEEPTVYVMSAYNGTNVTSTSYTPTEIGKITVSPMTTDVVPMILHEQDERYAFEISAFDGTYAGKYLVESGNNLTYGDEPAYTDISFGEAGTSANKYIVNNISFSDLSKTIQCSTTDSPNFNLASGNQRRVVLYMEDLADVSVRRVTVTADRVPEDDGYYNNAITVTLTTNTTGATIKYKINNEAEQTYTGPFEIDKTTTLTTYATKEGMENSVSQIYSYKFRPVLPQVSVTDGFVKNVNGEDIVISKTVVISPSTTEGSTSWLWNAETGVNEQLTEPVRLILVEAADIKVSVEKVGYTPASRSLNVPVELEYNAEQEAQYNYDAGIITSAWTTNNSDFTMNGVVWHMTAVQSDPNQDFGHHTSGGQVGTNEKPVTEVTISTSDFPGDITGISISPAGTAQTGGGTYTITIGGVEVDSRSFGTGASPINISDFHAEGEIVMHFTLNSGGGFAINAITVNFTPIADTNKVRTPHISLPSGQYQEDTVITISCSTEDAVIHYTLNGTVPDETSAVYTDPIIMKDDISLMARAYKEGLNPSNIASADFRIIETEVFQLVTAADQLTENDRIIIVNAVPMTGGVGGTVSFNDVENPIIKSAYYAMGTTTTKNDGAQVGSNSSKNYFDAIPVSVIESDDPNVPKQILVASNQNIAIIRLAKDGTNSDPDRPYLLQCTYEDEEKTIPLYFKSPKKKEMQLVRLPEDFSERGRMNSAVEIRESYRDFVKYHVNSTSTYCNKSADSKDYGIVENHASVVFSGLDDSNKTILTALRFNPVPNRERFNGYEYKIIDGTINDPDYNASTWPVQIYRAERVLAPSVTVYPKKVTEDGYETNAVSHDVKVFYNPIKVEIKENPRTKEGALLKYATTKEASLLPVAEEYHTFENSAVQGAKVSMYIDGFEASYVDPKGIYHNITDFDKTTATSEYYCAALLAMSELNTDEGVKSSRSMPTSISFETTAPVVKRATQDVEGVTKYGVKLSRPEVFTKGAYIFYTLDGPEPSVVWKQDNEGNWVPDFDNCVGTYYPTSDLGEFLEVGKGHVLKVGAFKYGYKPSIQEFGDNTVLPEALAVQLLELNPTGIGRLVANSNKISKTDKENLGIESITERTKDHEEDPTIYDVEQTKKIYLTNRAGKDDKYYMVGYTTGKVPQIDEQGNELDIHGNIWTSASGIEKMMVDGITDIAIVDVKNEEAKVVIDDPHLFKWTADYFVFGMDEDTFKSAMTDTENGAGFSEEQYEGIKESARIVFSDSKFYSRANKIEVELNEDDEAEAGEGNYDKKVYYGTVLSRKGSLGTNYMKSTFYYTTPPVVEGGVNQVYKTINHSSFTPTISMPFDLKYKYETYRDPVDDFIPDDHVKFESIGTSVKGISKEQTILFHKDHFTTRHFDAVFSFHRPNVCDDIIENYDIVYDITVESVKMNELTDIEEMIPITRKYVDPRKSKDIHESYYGDSTHDADNRYEFRVNDVHPLGSIHPKITINSVTYIPNGVNDGYATLAANYPTEEMLEELRANDLYSVEKEAPNTPEAASLEGASVTLLWNYNDPEDGTEPTFDWVIVDHNDLRNGATVIDKEVTMEAPFLYHLESIMGTDKNTYKSHEYLIPHNANTCQHGVEGEDPFYGIVLGSYPVSYIKNNSGIDPEIVVPTIYITPMYVFKREPQPFVEIEGNGLENYIISESADAPQSAPQKVITKNELPADLQNIILLRGSNTAIIDADSGIFTNVEQMKVDVETVMQVGNDLVLPEGARLFTTGGLEIEPRGLEADVYIVVLRSGKAIKVNVR